MKTFKIYNNQVDAEEVVQLLNDEEIHNELIVVKPSVDSSFVGGQSIIQYEIKISPNDLEKALSIIKQNAEMLAENAPSDHYLFSFTEEELYDVVRKPDEWNDYDVQLAKNILKEKGEILSEEKIEKFNNDRITELSIPDKINPLWIIFGYIVALGGGILGIAIGWFLWKSTKTLPNGEKIPAYNPDDRNQGSYIFILGVFVLLFALYLKIKLEIL